MTINGVSKTYANEYIPSPRPRMKTSNDIEESLDLQRWTSGQGCLLTFNEKRRGRGFQFQVHAQLMPSENWKLPITFYALEVCVTSIYQSNILGNLDMPLTLPYCCCRGNEIIWMEKNNKAVTEIQRQFNSTRCWETNFGPPANEMKWSIARGQNKHAKHTRTTMSL